MNSSVGDILTAMVTSFHKDGTVNFDGTAALASYLVENGSDGLVVSGTTGESPTLTDNEKIDLIRVVCDAVAGRATVVAGTGSNDTAHSIELTRRASEKGIDAILAVTPYYNKPPRAGLIKHFKALADAADGKPVILYNIPGRCVINIDPETICELNEIENIIAVKQANPDLEESRRLSRLCDIGLYAGNDDMLFPLLEMGGWGGICVASHIVGPQMKQMVELFRAGKIEEARAIDDRLKPLYDVLFITANPIMIKAALNMMGHKVGDVRLPLVPATEDEKAELRRVLDQLELIQQRT
ncbi:MAG: 4-hydroxy-tetrahydrodipicolinate synthase [Thermoleophilia bacterium]